MNENVKKVVARILKDIQVEMSDEFDKNFERQAFFSEKWQRRKSPIRNEGRAILTDTGALRKSIGCSMDGSRGFPETKGAGHGTKIRKKAGRQQDA